MKNKNLIWLGAILLGVYYLRKSSKKRNLGLPTIGLEMPTPIVTEKPIFTQPYQKFEFSKEDLLRTDRTIVLTEDVGMNKRMSAVLEYQLPYRGGVRPTRFMERTAGNWIVRGNLPLKTTKVCRGEILDMSSNNPSNCVMVARTQDVVDFIFSSDMKWNVRFGKAIRGGGRLPLPIIMGVPSERRL